MLPKSEECYFTIFNIELRVVYWLRVGYWMAEDNRKQNENLGENNIAFIFK